MIIDRFTSILPRSRRAVTLVSLAAAICLSGVVAAASTYLFMAAGRGNLPEPVSGEILAPAPIGAVAVPPAVQVPPPVLTEIVPIPGIVFPSTAVFVSATNPAPAPAQPAGAITVAAAPTPPAQEPDKPTPAAVPATPTPAVTSPPADDDGDDDDHDRGKKVGSVIKHPQKGDHGRSSHHLPWHAKSKKD